MPLIHCPPRARLLLPRIQYLWLAPLLAFGPMARLATPQDSRPYDPAPSLALVERHIDQSRIPFEQSRDHQKSWVCWRVEYLLRNEGATPIDLSPAAVSAEIDGSVSNARVPCHAVPRRVAHGLSLAEGSSGLVLESAARIVDSPDDSLCCREQARLELVTDPAPPNAGDPIPSPRPPRAVGADEPPPSTESPASLRLDPGQSLRARLVLEHQHFLYGPYDPLLGRREFTLRVGPVTFRDDLPLDRPIAEVFPPCTWGPLPADRLDPRLYVSAPDSLRLSAAIPGQHGFDFPERPVRYGTPMKLSFWYLIAPGLEGRCFAEIKQYRDAPRSYRALPDARVVEDLCQVGQWVQVQRVFRTDAQATTLRLRFCVDSDTGAGDLWIDDVRLEPLSAPPDGP